MVGTSVGSGSHENTAQTASSRRCGGRKSGPRRVPGRTRLLAPPLCVLSGQGGAGARVFLFLSGHASHCAPTLVTPRGLQMPTRGSGGLRHSVPNGGQRSLERGGGGDRGRSAQSTFGSGTRATCRGKRRAAGGEAWKGRRAPRAEGPHGQKGRCDSGGRWDRPVDCGGARGVLGPWGVRASSVTLRPPPPAPRCLSAAPSARSPRCAAPLTPSGPGGVTGRGGAPVPRPPPQPQPAFPPQCLASATEGVRLAARIVDTPCNEMNTDTFLEVRGPGGRAGGAEPGRAGGR